MGGYAATPAPTGGYVLVSNDPTGGPQAWTALAFGASVLKLKGYHSATSESVTVSGTSAHSSFLEVCAGVRACARTNASELSRTSGRGASAQVAFSPQVEDGPFTEPVTVPQRLHVRRYVCAYLFSGTVTVAHAQLSYVIK